MNSIMKAALKVNSFKSILNPIRSLSLSACKQQRQCVGSLWYMCNLKTANENNIHFGTKLNTLSNICNCGCGLRAAHTKAEQELVEFLTEEILAERKAQKRKTIPTEIDGFKAQLDGSEVTLTKKVDDETIKIQFNVNHTVDTDTEAEVHPNMDKPDMAELKSKPSFKVDMIRDNTTVSLVCSFISPDQQEDGYNDIFGIDEISIYDGEWNENVYSVSGDVVDSYLYDLLLNYMDEKGITNEFVEKLSEYSTAYEHSAYISLLEGLSKFVSKK